MRPLSARLRDETRADHDAVEIALDWEHRTTTAALYGEWLSRMHQFHHWWEPAIAAVIGDPDFIEPRRKLKLIEADLRALGLPVPPPSESVPSATIPSTPADAWGSLYVMEGSTLGGQLIAREVFKALGIRSAYHGSYGPATGAMWRAFKHRIDRSVPAAEHEATVAAARQTFCDLTAWLTD